MDYRHYSGQADAPQATLVLAHGFMRSLKTMVGWGEYWAAQGFETYVVSLCNSTLLNGHHRKNADDLLKLVDTLGEASVIYAGFSAGGLAAYLAALSDEQALGYIGLDAVDSGDLGIEKEANPALPALFIVAEPSSCNARNNFDQIIARYPSSQVKRLDNATHCQFEMLYSKRCGWMCGRRSVDETQAVQNELKARTTGWIQSLLKSR